MRDQNRTGTLHTSASSISTDALAFPQLFADGAQDPVCKAPESHCVLRASWVEGFRRKGRIGSTV